MFWFVGAANRLSTIDPQNHSLLDPGFTNAARLGEKFTAVERMQAELRRAGFGAKMDALLDDFDYIMSPAVPIAAFVAGSDVPAGSEVENSFEWSSFSFPINLSQQPACSVPCGLTSENLPIAYKLLGRAGTMRAC
ncbi:amidase family protein [Mesorhizobium sp. M0293]|uniref:amidase family protein n=1 Tax=Mesorhizobium sp. M0293 TaxID=2956930 RepID=UPI00333694F3